MVAFKLWSKFGAFRDPLTITQNLTLLIPPKTTIGGILASILGIDYKNKSKYFYDPNYFDFEYSVVLDKDNPVRKKSFAQNYVEDYTKNSEIKYNAINGLINENTVLDVINEIKTINNEDSVEYKKSEKKLFKFFDDISGKVTKPKPINRELLINPSYVIFINNFKYEDDLIELMKKHYSNFLLYMGNSEFPANYEFLDCKKVEKKQLLQVDSFTHSLDKIKFESERKYSTIYFATKVVNEREYRDYKKLVICNKPISFNKEIEGYNIQLSNGEYNCEFI